MKHKIYLLFIFLSATNLFAQNVGIGTLTPTLGKLEVKGVMGTGNTVAAFGSDGAGVSLQRNSPVIGFNQYRDGTGSKYMSNGFASSFTLNENTGKLTYDVFGLGTKNSQTTAQTNLFSFLNNGNMGIKGAEVIDATLSVPKRTSTGAVAFIGIKDGFGYHDSYFAYGLKEDTYIRPAVFSGDVTINDVPNGKIIIPNNTSIGLGGTSSPITSLDLFGALALSKKDTFNLNSTSNTYYPGNSSFVFVHPTTQFMTELHLGDGLVQGQILLILIDGNQYNGTFLSDTGNIDLTGTVVMQYNDLLTLMWRKTSATTGRWTEISYKQNEN